MGGNNNVSFEERGGATIRDVDKQIQSLKCDSQQHRMFDGRKDTDRTDSDLHVNPDQSKDLKDMGGHHGPVGDTSTL